MSRIQEAVRMVDAIGLVKAEFDWVGFNITIVGEGANSPKAKEDARVHVDATKATIEALKNESGVTIDPDSFRLSFSVAPKWSYDNGQQKQDGYSATYEISFRTKDLAKASLIMDKLTEVEEARVDSPNFHHNNPDAVYAQALDDARRKAENKFLEECSALGLDHTDFELVSWQVRDGQRGGQHGKAQAIAEEALACSSPASERSAVELEAGKAEISVYLTLNFAPKTTTTMANRKPSPSPFAD